MEIKDRMIEITLDSIRNIRDLGDTITRDGRKIRRNRLIRSAHLGRLNEEDLKYLKKNHHLDTVIDLRTYRETSEVPDQYYDLKSLHLPKDPIKALDFLLSHDAAPVDTGTVNGEFFLNVCGTGFDVTVLDYAEKNKAKTRGLTPYFLGLLEAIFHYRPLRLTVTRDGKRETIDALICSVANGQYIGGGIPICPAADPTDGLIDLVLIKGIPRWRIPFYLPGLMMSGALRFRITRHETVQKVLVEGNGLRVNIDGDIRSMEKAEFAVHPGSLMLIH